MEALIEHPNCSAAEIGRIVGEKGRGYTRQAVHQELRKLERAGVLVRKAGRYALRYQWLLEATEFLHRGFGAYRESGALGEEIPDEGKKVSWVLYDLRSLLDLWTDITFRLVCRLSPSNRLLCEYVVHAWFHTVNPINESYFVRLMNRERVKYAIVCLGSTYLDKSYTQVLNGLTALHSFGDRGFPAGEHQYFSVIGDFLIFVSLPLTFSRSLEEFYQSIRSSKDLSPQKILSFAGSRVKTKLTLARSARQAAKQRRKFEQFFGERFSGKSTKTSKRAP